MTTTVRRLITGTVFAAMLALSLGATSSDAYAKSISRTGADKTLTTSQPQQNGGFDALGVTWE